jgi:hypothetical protein
MRGGEAAVSHPGACRSPEYESEGVIDEIARKQNHLEELLIICPPLHRARARRSSATTPPRSAVPSRSQASCLEYPDWVPEELKNGYMWHPDNSDNQWWWTHSPSSLPASSRTYSHQQAA